MCSCNPSSALWCPNCRPQDFYTVTKPGSHFAIQGWQCFRCHAVMAPWMSRCINCAPVKYEEATFSSGTANYTKEQVERMQFRGT